MIFTKKAFEEFFRYHDFSALLNQNENLSEATVVVIDKSTGKPDATMISNASVFQSKKVLYKIQSGISGHIYRIVFRVATTAGQKFEDEIDCEVK